MKSTRSVGCNHFEEMYVIRNLFRYVINPKEDTPAVMPYTLRVITCAYRRLHANPSDWIKIRQSEDCLIFCHSCPKKNWLKTEDFLLFSR